MNEISQLDASYSGSTIFNPLAHRFGLSIDLVSDKLCPDDRNKVKTVIKCAIFKRAKRKQFGDKKKERMKTPKKIN